MFGGTNLKNFLLGGTREREFAETRRSWDRVQTQWRASPLSSKDLSKWAAQIALLSVRQLDRQPIMSILVGVTEAIEALLNAEAVGDLTALWDVIEADPAVAVEFRRMLVRRQRWISDYDRMSRAFSRIVVSGLSAFYSALPDSCFDEEEGQFDTFEVPIIDLFDDAAAVIDQLFMIPYDDDSFRLDLFSQLREICATDLLVASGFLPETNIREVRQKLIRAPDQKGKTGAELIALYLAGSPFRALLNIPIPFCIPEETRFEHCHIVGGTGHGKTQLLQKMIHNDLLASCADRRSVVVIDSQGDLINKLVHLELFSPDDPASLHSKLILIDPSDVTFPVALNLFDAHLDRLKQYGPADRERVLNGVVELYELFFGAFLGSELTQKQGVIFKYLARLMLAIPRATIYTLMEIMEDGKRFTPFIEALDPSARYFFETEFFHPSFTATKRQVVRRLWGVLSTPAFERMFTQPTNKIDLFSALNDGHILLINTAKEFLKREGSQLLGRFFIAMLTQALLERSTIPQNRRTPVSVYVDEAQEYFDDSIETILNQARKYHVGITVAHQTLEQLAPPLRSAIFSNTSFKCAGGVSAKDARTLADELHTTPEFIKGMKRRGVRSEFATWVKHRTGTAIRLTVELGYLERQPTLTEEAYQDLITANRVAYCGTAADVVQFRRSRTDATSGSNASQLGEPAAHARPHSPTDVSLQPLHVAKMQNVRSTPTATRQPEVMNAALGKGGSKHRYLQSIVKELAVAQGLKATIEAPLPDGTQVDVLIERDGIVAAIEISVSTSAEHERENLAKCLAAGAPRVAVVIAKSRVNQAQFREALAGAVASVDRERVTFLTPEEIPQFVASLVPPDLSQDRVVRGYRVKGSVTAVDSDEARVRRETLAGLIARNLSKKID